MSYFTDASKDQVRKSVLLPDVICSRQPENNIDSKYKVILSRNIRKNLQYLEPNFADKLTSNDLFIT